MAETTEHIVFVIEAIKKGFDATVNGVAKTMKGIENNFQKINQTLRQNDKQFSSLTKSIKKTQMQMLGILFFGQSIKQTFLGLLQPTLDLFGVFDLFSTMLAITFLPVIEQLFPYFLQMMDFFMNLPEPLQLVVGWIAIAGVVFGSLLATIGALDLGIGSLLTGFNGFNIVTIILQGLTASAGVLLAAFVVIAVGIWLAWQENFGKIQDWVAVIFEGIRNMWEGFKTVLQGIWNVLVGLFTGDSEKIVDGLKKIWNGFFHYLGGVLEFILGVILTVGLGVLKLIFNIAKAGYNLGKDLISRLIEGIKSTGTKLADTLWSLLPDWMKKLIKGAGSFISSLVDKIGLKGNMDSSTTLPKKQDFIWRPGSGAVSVSPQDTLVGFKKGEVPGGLGGGGIVINMNNTYQASTLRELEMMVERANRRLVDDLRSRVKVGF